MDLWPDYYETVIKGLLGAATKLMSDPIRVAPFPQAPRSQALPVVVPLTDPAPIHGLPVASL